MMFRDEWPIIAIFIVFMAIVVFIMHKGEQMDRAEGWDTSGRYIVRTVDGCLEVRSGRDVDRVRPIDCYAKEVVTK